jgi:N-acetyltransferase
MKTPEPVTLQDGIVRLEPMQPEHASALEAAALEDDLWKLRVTFLPGPGEGAAYVAYALKMQSEGTRLPFVVRHLPSNTIVGTTSYHDIVLPVQRIEIGYTWYATRMQRTALNTTCKRLLITHAFDTLGAQLVGLRTDNLNERSQRAIERLGAKKDGVLRHHGLRKDGSVRDTVMYSITKAEWPSVQQRLDAMLAPTLAG